MILGVNGIRLVKNRSGVAQCIQAFLASMDEVDHPFSEIRVYTPDPLPDDIRLPSRAVNVVLSSALPPGLWEQYTLPRAHGSKHSCSVPVMSFQFWPDVQLS
jgi:hypothetical protein